MILIVFGYIKNFLGKTNDEIQQRFLHVCPIEYIDSLRWMPAIPFRYYMQGVIDFILNRKFGQMDAADAASPFLMLVEEKLREDPEPISQIMNGILPTVEYIANNQASYHAEISIYGDFHQQEERIKLLWDAYSNKKQRNLKSY